MIGPQHFGNFLDRLRPRLFLGCLQHVLVQVIVQHLAGQPVQRAADRGKQLQDLAAGTLGLQRALDGLESAP